jgi:hypothetical protein
MSTKTASFITELSVNPSKLRQFTSNPDMILMEAGFSREEMNILKSNDSLRICDHITKELGNNKLYPGSDSM